MDSYKGLLQAFEHLNNRKRKAQDSLTKLEKDRWRVMRCQIEEALFQRPGDPGSDSREFLRIPVSLKVRYQYDNVRKDSYISILGEDGLFINTQEPLSPEHKLSITIQPKDARLPITINAKVVWHTHEGPTSHWGMGLRFIDLTEAQRTDVFSLIDDTLYQKLIERRKYSRIDTRLQVTVWVDDKPTTFQTEDISLGGMFVATPHPPKSGQELKFELCMPAKFKNIKGIAKVVRTIQRFKGKFLRGFASRFLFLDLKSNDRLALKRFLCQRLTGELPPIEDDRRKYARLKRRIKVRYQSSSAFATTDARDMSAGGIFIQTREPPALHSEMDITLLHPITDQKIVVPGKVIRSVQPDPQVPVEIPGIGVSFDGIPIRERKQLENFLKDFVMLEEED